MFNKKKKVNVGMEEGRQPIFSNLSFAASEAYKLLRTNLDFSLPASDKGKIIGVTSSISGEGKSTTAINIAYTYAQTGKKVLLLEGDMRLPTIGKRVKTPVKSGLSNLLAGQCEYRDVLQKYSAAGNLWLITAGDIPPNPAELLGSSRMGAFLQAFSDNFDVIIVDLPPIGVVSDALIVSKFLDGMILVVRQDFVETDDLDETIRQLRFADAKILGFVQTGATTQQKSYDHDYGYGHSYDYAQSAETHK